MCGIVGVINADGRSVEPDLLARMRDTMVHRGPDDQGLYLDGNAGLGHRRLSILDLSAAGHQPMSNRDESLWLVFNGEIYNYVELEEELKTQGHEFRSSSDSEVILHLYEEMGIECLERLNGMFAFAIWDRRRRTLFGARDRLGIKPFYYNHTPEHFIFASEIKAILEDPSVARRPDRRGIADYLFCGQPLAGRTLFEGIEEVRPGWAFELKDGRLRPWEYWRLSYDYDDSRSDGQVIDEVAALVDDAVRIHCRSDAPVGCHLSGGLDSSTVACLTTQHRGPVESFSIRSPGGSAYDETPYAKAVSRHAGTQYCEDTVDAADLGKLTSKLLWHMDMPMPSAGGVNYYAASRLAAEHVKVSLTGHGGDEVFAGYPGQFELAFGTRSMFDTAAVPAVQEAGLAYRLRTLWSSKGVAGLTERLRARYAPSAERSLEEKWTHIRGCSAPKDTPYLDPGFIESLGDYSPVDDYLEAFRGAPTEEILDRCLHHDLRNYVTKLLFMEDRASMAVSIESRVPLLDYRIAEYVARVPVEQKVRGQVPKYLLREAARRWIPDEVLERRDKLGFPMPTQQWFGNELAGDLEQVLGTSGARKRGIFRKSVLGDRNFWVTQGWQALNLELWFRIFIERDLEPGIPLREVE